MIGKILYVAFLGFVLVQSNPLRLREKRSYSDEDNSENGTTIQRRNEVQSNEESKELTANDTTIVCCDGSSAASSEELSDDANVTTIACCNELHSTGESSKKIVKHFFGATNSTDIRELMKKCKITVRTTNDMLRSVSLKCFMENCKFYFSRPFRAQRRRVDALCDTAPSGSREPLENSPETSKMSTERRDETIVSREEFAVSPYTCLICYKDEREILFEPCRHIIACFQCGITMKSCTLCERWIHSMLKVFIS